MMALVHAALFHVAAQRHFAGRDLPHGLTIAAHPGIVGDTPTPNHAGHQVGIRFPITHPPGGGTARPAGIGYPDGTWQTLRFTGQRISGRIVDTSQPGARDDTN